MACGFNTDHLKIDWQNTERGTSNNTQESSMREDSKFEQLDTYEVKEQLFQGLGRVLCEAFDPVNERHVLLSIWTDLPGADEEYYAALEQHIQALMVLRHPNVIGIHTYQIHREQALVYWAMPFVAGHSLRQRLGKAWPVSEAVRVVAELAQALHYVHQQDLVHGMVCPESILLTERGWPLLTDCGMATFIEEGHKQGLAIYWPPEQLPTMSAQPAADLYALGAILYEMLVGHPPFEGEDRESLYERQLQGPSFSRAERKTIPDGVVSILMELLSANSEDLFCDGAELARRLVAALPADSPGVARPVTPPPNTHFEPELSIEGMRESETTLWSRAAPVLWRITRWLLGKMAAAAVVLLFVFAALGIGATFLLTSLLEQRLSVQEWYLDPWAEGGETRILKEDLDRPLQRAVEPYALGLLKDLEADFQSPDVIVVGGMFQERPLTLVTRLDLESGVPQIQLQQLNGIPLYVVGGAISNGINRGLQTSWETVPVRVSVLQVEAERIEVVLIPVQRYKGGE